MLDTATYYENSGVLDLQFISGKRYRYFGVPMEIYLGISTAPSSGFFYNLRIKGRYPSEQIW
jgi:lysyl-tRNA synthetase class 2